MIVAASPRCEHPTYARHLMRAWGPTDPQNMTGRFVQLVQCGPCRGMSFTDQEGVPLPGRPIDFEGPARV